MLEIGNVVVSVEDGIALFDNGAKIKLGAIQRKKGRTIEVFAFTGMRLGDLEVIKETDKTIKAIRGDGRELIFDKKTGLQTNCKNPRFANRLQA